MIYQRLAKVFLICSEEERVLAPEIRQLSCWAFPGVARGRLKAGRIGQIG
jgi:hypothetical protein